jgi:hypothetical protein
MIVTEVVAYIVIERYDLKRVQAGWKQRNLQSVSIARVGLRSKVVPDHTERVLLDKTMYHSFLGVQIFLFLSNVHVAEVENERRTNVKSLSTNFQTSR